MPYGSSWTIVGSCNVSLMLAVILDCAINRLVLARGNTELHYKWTSTCYISNCALTVAQHLQRNSKKNGIKG